MMAERARRGLAAVGGLVALMWAAHLVNIVLGSAPVFWLGIESRSIDGLDGILFAPLLHGGFSHLLNNSVPLLVFGFLTFLSGVRQFITVLAASWLVSGLGVWLVGDGITIGASGVVFGLFAYLVVRGFYNRSWTQLLLAAVLFAAYGSILWGVLPTAGAGVSWQAHLFGAAGGVLAAFMLRTRQRPAS
jgi:membrane associated rhomboid family serine protease